MRNDIPTTEAADRATGYARREAQRLDHAAIEPAHLLLGLALDTEGRAASLMRGFGIDLKELRLRIEQSLEPGEPLNLDEINLSSRSRAVMKKAGEEARKLGQSGIEGEHVLLALLSDHDDMPSKLVAEMGLHYDELRARLDRATAGKRGERQTVRAFARPATGLSLKAIRSVPVEVSPVFVGICMSTLVFAMLMYFRVIADIALLFFVIGGWVISLCLHEFGHAFVAYLGGDIDVYDKGYLSLNPFKYTHPVLSIVLPLVFLLLGGLGLPGGAVYVNRNAIRGSGMNSLVSAAGPIATALCAIVLLIPFVTGIAYSNLNAHPEFWAGIALLAMLEISGVLLNLLPIPGIDGFGIIAPFLHPSVRDALMPLSRFTFLFLMLLFFTPLGGVFWDGVFAACMAFNLEPWLAIEGLQLFRFWA
jgi:Zn-dependent protease